MVIDTTLGGHDPIPETGKPDHDANVTKDFPINSNELRSGGRELRPDRVRMLSEKRNAAKLVDLIGHTKRWSDKSQRALAGLDRRSAQ